MIYGRTSPVLKTLGEGRLEGIAWSFEAQPDHEGDVILRSAFDGLPKALPLPLLVGHKGVPVGQVDTADIRDDGVHITAHLHMQQTAAGDAYLRLKSGDLRALSIGFRGQSEQAGAVRVWTAVELAEISVVQSPMNSGATIAAVKGWQSADSAIDLERFFHSAGMPRRLAQKCAAAAWPAIQRHDTDPSPDLVAAYQRLARACKSL